MTNAKYDKDRGEMMMRNDDDADKMTNNNTIVTNIRIM
jgi:hypothetical protein